MSSPFPPTAGSASPWGPIQHVTALGKASLAVSTASHGGIRVSPEAYARLPEPLRRTAYSAGGWYEEDCDWAIPYLALGLDAHEAVPEPGRGCARPRGAQSGPAIGRRRTSWGSGTTPPSPEGGPMVEQPDLFTGGVAEAAPLRPITPAEDLTAPGRRLDAIDLAALPEVEILALILRRCLGPGEDPMTAAEALLEAFGGIRRVVGATLPDLARVVGAQAAETLALLHALVVRALDYPLRRRDGLSSHAAVAAYLRARLAARPREAFHVLFLDKANRLIADERMGDGTVDHAPVYPREVVRQALERSASAVCLVHNHPSGGASPSSADIEMTKRVVEAARALGIAVHDHFLVAGDDVVSFRGLGLM